MWAENRFGGRKIDLVVGKLFGWPPKRCTSLVHRFGGSDLKRKIESSSRWRLPEPLLRSERRRSARNFHAATNAGPRKSSRYFRNAGPWDFPRSGISRNAGPWDFPRSGIAAGRPPFCLDFLGPLQIVRPSRGKFPRALGMSREFVQIPRVSRKVWDFQQVLGFPRVGDFPR